MPVNQRVAAYGVVVDSGRVLLSHWRAAGLWILPGGGIEPFEDPADAAVRELLEETGLAVELDELLGVDSVVVPASERADPSDGPLHWLRIVYRAHVMGGELRDETDGSTDTAAWFDLDELAGMPRVGLVDVGLRLAGYPIERENRP